MYLDVSDVYPKMYLGLSFGIRVKCQDTCILLKCNMACQIHLRYIDPECTLNDTVDVTLDAYQDTSGYLTHSRYMRDTYEIHVSARVIKIHAGYRSKIHHDASRHLATHHDTSRHITTHQDTSRYICILSYLKPQIMRPAVINIPTLIVSGLRHDCSPRGAAERGPGPAPRSRATRGPPTTSISKRIRGAVLARQPDHDCIMITNRLLTERLYLGGCRVAAHVLLASYARRLPPNEPIRG